MKPFQTERIVGGDPQNRRIYSGNGCEDLCGGKQDILFRKSALGA